MAHEDAALVHAACFLTWSHHRRTTSLARRLNLRLVEIVSSHRGLYRYAEVTLRTVRFLIGSRPRLVVVQNPSLVLSALAMALRPFLGYRLVIDAHNEAVEPYLHSALTILLLTDFLLRTADRVIVTNEPLAEIVRRKGGNPMVLPDPVPSVVRDDYGPVSDEFRVVVVSTYAADEPFAEVTEAARIIGSRMRFFVTGDPARLDPGVIGRLPDNVLLTGFLAESDYWELLATSSVVLDLTEMPNCLVCGAYEALAVGVPVVLSDNRASMESFGGFAVFSGNVRHQIVEALNRVHAQHAVIASRMPSARDAFESSWLQRMQYVREYISQVCDVDA